MRIKHVMFKLFRVTKILITFPFEIIKLLLKPHPAIKLLGLKFILNAFIIIFNSYIFKSILDLDNNVHFFIMMVGSRFINFFVIFLYDETRLLKFAFYNKKVYLVIEKLKRKLRKSLVIENILTSFLVYISCVILKKLLLGLGIFNVYNPLNLCIFVSILMVFSIVSRHIIIKWVKWVIHQTKS